MKLIVVLPAAPSAAHRRCRRADPSLRRALSHRRETPSPSAEDPKCVFLPKVPFLHSECRAIVYRMNGNVRILQVDRAFVLEKCNSFVDFQLWPIRSELDPEGWLGNFTEAEQAHALHLLNAFIYFSHDLTRDIFLSSFQSISSSLRERNHDFVPVRDSWRNFCDNLVVTYITGEVPSPTDSGYIFARMARQFLGISQNRIFEPKEALRLLVEGQKRPVLFVDDFVGTGQQFVATWERLYDVGQTAHSSFKLFAASQGGQFFSCPVLSTAHGAAEISRSCPQVKTIPGNILDPKYSALHPNSVVWPDSLRATGAAFIREASRRAGIPDKNGGVDDWRGFNKQGLCVGFSHSIPDATLPLFYWNQNAWIPLRRKR
jgi:hypothetical protein